RRSADRTGCAAFDTGFAAGRDCGGAQAGAAVETWRLRTVFAGLGAFTTKDVKLHEGIPGPESARSSLPFGKSFTATEPARYLVFLTAARVVSQSMCIAQPLGDLS